MKTVTWITGAVLIALIVLGIFPPIATIGQSNSTTSTNTNTTNTSADDVLDLIKRVEVIINNTKSIGIPTDEAEVLLQEAITLYYNGDLEGAKKAAVSALESLGISMALFGLSSGNQTVTNQTQSSNGTSNQTTGQTSTNTPVNQTQTSNNTSINQTISEYIQGLFNMTYEEKLNLLTSRVNTTLNTLESRVQKLTSLSDQEKQLIIQKIEEIRQLLNNGKVFQAILELKRVMKAVHEYIEEENKIKLKLYLKLKLEKDDIIKYVLNATDGNNTLAKFGKKLKELLKKVNENDFDPEDLAKLMRTEAILKHMIRQTDKNIIGNMLGNATMQVYGEDVAEDIEKDIKMSVLWRGYGYNGSLLLPVEILLNRSEAMIDRINTTMNPMHQQIAKLILEQINHMRKAVSYTRMAIQAYNSNDTDAFYNYLAQARFIAKSAKEMLGELDEGVFKPPAKMGEAAGEILLKIIDKLENHQYLPPKQGKVVLKGIVTSVGNNTLTVWGTIYTIPKIAVTSPGLIKAEHEMLPAPSYWKVIISNDTKIIGNLQELVPILVIGVIGKFDGNNSTINAKLIKVGAVKEFLKNIDDILEEHWEDIEEKTHETHGEEGQEHGNNHGNSGHGNSGHHGSNGDHHDSEEDEEE